MHTTPVTLNKNTKRLQAVFDRILQYCPTVTHFTVTPAEYNAYCESISPYLRATMKGNPYYKGVEIKKMGEA